MQRVIRTLQQAQTARQQAQFYDAYKAKLNILYPSHHVICQFIFDKILAWQQRTLRKPLVNFHHQSFHFLGEIKPPC